MRAVVLLAAGLLVAACGGPVPPWPAPPAIALDLRLDVAPTKVTLLQPLVVSLDLYRARPDLEIEFAPEVPAKDFLCTTVRSPEVPFGDGRWQHTTLVLRPRRGPGELSLPAFVARAKDGSLVATTPETKIEVLSAIGDHGAALEAPADPFGPRVPYGLYGGVALAAVALLTAIWFFTRHRRRPLPAATPVPAHVRALRELARLRAAPRGTAGQIEAFYVDVSNVLRLYLEERFGLCAPERTTEEFLRELETGDALLREHRAELQQFLQQCDLVKFAAHLPQEKDHLATFALAEAFVEKTRPDRRQEAIA